MKQQRAICQSAVVLAAIGVFTILTGCPQPAGHQTGGPQLVFSGLNPALLSISGTSPQDVYAVGADPGDGLGPYVLHFDGRQWRRLSTGLTGHLWWISVTAIDGAFYLAGAEGKVVKFTPSSQSFEKLSTPGNQTIYGVWGSSASSLWAVGGNPDDPDHGGVIWHFDGTSGSVIDLSGVLPDGTPILYKVWGRSADDVYAVGRLGLILHFDGSTWSKLASDTTRTLITVHGNAAQTIAVGGITDGVIVETAAADAGAFSSRAPVGTPPVNGVFAPPNGPAVAVGTRGAVFLRESSGWAPQSYDFNTTRDFHTVWVDPDGGIWAVGGDLSVNLKDGILAYVGDANISTQVAP